MPASIRRVLRFLRLALVCLTLVWSSAPAAAAPITDTIALVAASREADRAAAPADLALTPRAEPAARAAFGEPRADHPPATRAPSRPRRLYLEHRALLC